LEAADPPAVVAVYLDGDAVPALTVVGDEPFEAVQTAVHYAQQRLHHPTKEPAVPQSREVISHHLFRRTARREKQRIERLQATARGPLEDRKVSAAFRQLKELGVGRYDVISIEKPVRGFRWQLVAISNS
jgi:hypothetical protein